MPDHAILNRISIFRKMLENKPFDTAWIVQPENRRYLSGFKAIDTQFTESSGSLFINLKDSLLATDSRYTTEALNEAEHFEVHTLTQGIVTGLPELMKNLGTRNLGFEEDYVVWSLYKNLDEKLGSLSPDVRLIPMEGLVEEMREVKDSCEIETMNAAADIMSSVLDEIVSSLKPGDTEKEIAHKIEFLAKDAGAEGLSFPPIVASGPNSALPHAVPGDRKIKESEPVIFDIGCRLNGYCSDMTRTVFLGDPDPELKKIYMIVRKAQLAALKEIKPGIESSWPDNVARKIIEDEGYGHFFGHGLGHGVGLAVHENPRLGPKKPVKLKKGMVVTVEPGIYIPGKGGVRLEEMVVIEDGGPRILTSNQHFYTF